MNILILNWRDPEHPNAGGAEQVTLEHAKGWIKGGHNVWWFSSTFQEAKTNEFIDGVNIIRSGRQVFGVHIKACLWYLFKKHPKFDLVIDQFHGIPFFTPLYMRTKKLAFIHEVAKEVWNLNPWPKPFHIIPAIFGTLLEPFVFKILYKNIPFMTVSESTRDDLKKWGINNIKVIHNGVLLHLPNPLPKKEKVPTALFLGAISPDKGIFDAIKTFAEIVKMDAVWQFWIVGKGTKEIIDDLQNLAREMQIDKQITFWGFVDEKKKFELLSRANILINPSIREGWCLVNIEASASGTPVVGYNSAGLRDSIKNGRTGTLVESRNYKKLAEEAISLMNDKKRYNEYSHNSIAWSKSFRWEKSITKSLDLIERVVRS